MRDNIIVDVAEDLNVNRVTGGRAVVSGHIVSNHVDIFAANERGPNFLYRNDEGNFVDIALEILMYRMFFRTEGVHRLLMFSTEAV